MIIFGLWLAWISAVFNGALAIAYAATSERRAWWHVAMSAASIASFVVIAIQ